MTLGMHGAGNVEIELVLLDFDVLSNNFFLIGLIAIWNITTKNRYFLEGHGLDALICVFG